MIRAVVVLAITTFATTFAATFAVPARADPPPMGSDDWKVMSPYTKWVHNQADRFGAWCCDISDGRPVDARINAAGHWEAHVTSQHWPGAEDHWIEIPDMAVLHNENPVGIPILWYSIQRDHPYCFAPADGT